MKLLRDESGAALLEYTALLGIMLATVIVVIGLVGDRVSGKWGTLAAAILSH
jgi:Flp pilus assembly pilin Flp